MAEVNGCSNIVPLNKEEILLQELNYFEIFILILSNCKVIAMPRKDSYVSSKAITTSQKKLRLS
jgi:hypothetical protein